MNRRRGVLVIGAVVLVLGLVLALSRPTEDRYRRPPLDPRGTGPRGTAALVELLRDHGADVRIGGQPSDADDVVLQLSDTFSGGANDRLEQWVRDGGTLVVADPFAALAPPLADDLGSSRATPGPDCEIEALAGLDSISPPLPLAFRDAPDTSSCFLGPEDWDDSRPAGVDLRAEGAGLVVGLSSVAPFENANLGRVDSSVLAVALLVPWDGAQVRVLDPHRLVGDSEDVGDGTVLGALPARGRQAVGQLVVAFLVWGLVRGRRLGQPVTEELPVPLPASDLVLASGRLLDRNGDAADAAERLRRRARRQIGTSLGLGPDPDPRQLADALVARAGTDPALVTAALLAPVPDDAALVATASHLDRLRQELRP